MINVKSKYIGIEFLDMQYNRNKVESFSENFNAYLVKNERSSIAREIMTESDIEFYLNKQEAIIESKINMEQIRKEVQEKRDQEEKEYNYCNGFCDNMSPMQKGNVLKTLNKKISYGFGSYGVLTCKEFICKALKDGYTPIVRHDVKYYSKRSDKGYTVKPTVYSMKDKDGLTVDITKTEYDYALHLQTK